ncbi:phosphoribosylaminoimidazole synthetase [Thiovulum sp. ES]|nr:phosphoribosylaminoimidazole synthetase [Thiovulum sp. ES]
MSKVSYKDSGVDIDAGNSLVERIKPIVKKSFDGNVLGGIGSFAGAYKLPTGYKSPVLLSATDGVGTKLKLAIDSKRFDTVGEDLVAMCVNDLICNFAKPMFFLDYYATGKLAIDEAESVISGIANGCIKAESSLVGGETAEMPSMYSEGDFDLAGFAVGIAEEDEIDRRGKISEGDDLIALPSSGLHSNGFSLARKVLFDKMNLKLEGELLETLLTPTRIYVKEFLELKEKINALAHITGGGLLENLPRVFPENLGAEIEKDKIRVHGIFKTIGEHVEESEMWRTFNMGVGMVVVVSPENSDEVLQKTDGYKIGKVVKGEGVSLK